MPSISDIAATSPPEPRRLRTLLVDNYDSYTFNLLQLLVQSHGAHKDAQSNIIVIRNNQYSWEEVRDKILPHIDNVIISPGPGNPSRKEDFGICEELIRSSLKPLLGRFSVRLLFVVWYQSTGRRARSRLSHRHGLMSPGCLTASPICSRSREGFPEELQVLARATGTVCADSAEGARTVETSDIMALRHRSLPLYGVQFHPESICSEYGARILDNFYRITEWFAGKQEPGPIPAHVQAMSLLSLDDKVWNSNSVHSPRQPRFSLFADVVDLGSVQKPTDIGSRLFQHLYGNDDMPLWLDSAKAGDANSNISVMASGRSTHSATVRYTVHDRKISAVQFPEFGQEHRELDKHHLPAADGVSFWTWMQSIANDTQISGRPADVQWCAQDRRLDDELRGLGFRCGWVGYFGYEMKSETVAEDPLHKDPVFVNEEDGRLPDAQLSFVDRCVVLDHRCDPPRAFILALANSIPHTPNGTSTGDACTAPWVYQLAGTGDDAMQWIAKQVQSISSWAASCKEPAAVAAATPQYSNALSSLEPTMPRDTYISEIRQAKDWIAQGESYEICLTNQFHIALDQHLAPVRSAQDMQQLYQFMRARNPAPYGALMYFPDIKMGLASCSPERFLRIEQASDSGERWGTARRDPKPTCRAVAKSLQENVKERAENLMIVDLIRHDLNWIAERGCVQTYASVHQMVTTVRAQIRRNVGDVAALAHCFPPGSMTGAPKRRTLQILHGLERDQQKRATPRGVYSGCLGVVIRTAVVDRRGSRLSAGAGGALTILSDPEEEWTEYIGARQI
ncbi:ADC synthase [Linderina pennispora]|uniref:aminodeoxychorismate synthase n=1 Tax=Linderina pennispora TaxID=61395 RepID=A0A1Y1WEA7_9FUNG|nr:ADC synthase [Linderina pennispora]ORX71668.1 ADC synthase [Linderina pennispora]